MDIPASIIASIIIAMISAIAPILIFWRQIRADSLSAKTEAVKDSTTAMKAVQEAAVAMLAPLTNSLDEINRKYLELEKKYDEECKKSDSYEEQIEKLVYDQKAFQIQLNGALDQLATRSRRVSELHSILDNKEDEWNRLLREKDEVISTLQAKVEQLEERVMTLENVVPSNGIKD